MDISYTCISEVFQGNLSKYIRTHNNNEFTKLLEDCINTNIKLWRLEDISRMHDLGNESIANAKIKIDVFNQIRNETIAKLDHYLTNHLNNTNLNGFANFISESPGILIDRISILHIKRYFVNQLLQQIQNKEIKNEYQNIEEQICENINDLGTYLDTLFKKILKGESFFKIYRPLKVYNDKRVQTYIKNIGNNLIDLASI